MKLSNISLIILIFTLSFTACNTEKGKTDLILWYETPALEWNEALPIGNGRLGAMVFGDPSEEHIQLNEETVWAGGPHNNVNPEVAPYLVKVRDLIFQGQYEESHTLANEKIKAYQNGMPYQTMGDLMISFPGVEDYSSYHRELDLTRAITTTKFESKGITFTREVFSSFTDQVIIVKLSADKEASIYCTAILTSPQDHSIVVKNNQVLMSGTTTSHENIPGQVKFTTILKPSLKNGTLIEQDTSLIIQNADEVIFYISAASNFKNYNDISGNPDSIAQAYMQEATIKNYKHAREEHISFYSAYFDRVSLDLGSNDSVKNPTDKRIAQFKSGNDPQLAELYFQFGRYLLISSSQPGGQPANLQGIWNDMLSPPWESKYTININCEMNYWPAEVTNLTELSDPLFSMINDLSITGREAAHKLYNARGWVAHHNTDIWRASGIYDRATYGMWQSGGNWLTQHLWQHFLYTGDTAFLKENYPILKSAAEFYVDELVEEPTTGYLVISPSNSPENKYMNLASSSAGTTMDNQLLFDLFSNVIRSSELLDKDHDFSDTLRMNLDRLAPMQIGQHNQLQEWLYDWDRPEDKHRHVSHLYGLYPSNQISPFRNSKLTQAAKQSLIYRGDESTGWSMGWKVNLWARLLDGNHAYKMIKDQISPAKRPNGEVHGGTYPNLFDAHPPFQIDGNFGCAAGIAEMLIQSHDGFLFILPSLPDAWPDGEVTGLKARGGFEVDIKWSDTKIETVKILSELGGNLRIRTWDEIESSDVSEMLPASGENPNPLFALNQIKEPVISDKANPAQFELEESFLYDFETIKGDFYTISLKK